jgi:hypothetical protein
LILFTGGAAFLNIKKPEKKTDQHQGDDAIQQTS